MPGFVYGLTDPRYEDEVRYVGKTMGTLYGRWWGHVNEAKKKPGSHISRLRWIQKLLALGLEPGIITIESNEDWDDATAYAHEAFWISYYRHRFGNRILNIADGGDHTVWATTTWTPEMRAHLSRKMREYYAKNPSRAGNAEQVAARKIGLAKFWADPARSAEQRERSSRVSKAFWASMTQEERKSLVSPEARARTAAALRKRFSNPQNRQALSVAVKMAMTPELVAARNEKNRQVRHQQRGYVIPDRNWNRPCVVCGRPVENPARWQTRSCPPCKNKMLSLARSKKIESKADYEARILHEWNS